MNIYLKNKMILSCFAPYNMCNLHTLKLSWYKNVTGVSILFPLEKINIHHLNLRGVHTPPMYILPKTN